MTCKVVPIRPGLWVDRSAGKVKSSPEPERLERVRQSLDKINRLMAELKEATSDDNSNKGEK
jgi:hypothetical protein